MEIQKQLYPLSYRQNERRQLNIQSKFNKPNPYKPRTWNLLDKKQEFNQKHKTQSFDYSVYNKRFELAQQGLFDPEVLGKEEILNKFLQAEIRKMFFEKQQQ